MTHKNLYFRTRINDVGIRPKPAPTLEVPRFNSHALDFQLRDLAQNKAFIDLSDMEVRFCVRAEKYHLGEPLIEKTSLDDIDITSATLGEVTVNLNEQDLNIPVSEYWYDVIIVRESPNDEFHSQTTGIFRVLS